MVCQNQSIDESDADLARDLRILVRQRLVAGDTDQQVMDYIVSRYGEFVLLKPRFSPRNALLWGTPVLSASGRRGFHRADHALPPLAGNQGAERRGTGGAGHHPAPRLTATRRKHYKSFMLRKWRRNVRLSIPLLRGCSAEPHPLKRGYEIHEYCPQFIFPHPQAPLGCCRFAGHCRRHRLRRRRHRHGPRSGRCRACRGAAGAGLRRCRRARFAGRRQRQGQGQDPAGRR